MYDICVIGAGWAGFNAAIRAKELGAKKVILIEKREIGGTCLNRGCIPTKVLVHSAKSFSSVKKSKEFGVSVGDISLDFSHIIQRKDETILKLKSGMQFLLKQKDIQVINGVAEFLSNNEVSVNGETIVADYFVVAIGSKPLELPSLKFDGKHIISSDDVLKLNTLPKDILIVGGGVIGCEFASIFSQLGVQVTIIELMDRILPLEDREISVKLATAFKKNGIEIITGKSAQRSDANKFEKVLVCVSRKANLESLNLDKIGIEKDENGIKTDKFLKTSAKNVYAAGDCTGKSMLAHSASMEGRLAIENIFLKPNGVNYEAIPNCIFTDPAVASCGISQARAEELNIPVQVGKFDFRGLGMAHILGATDGFIKIIVHKDTHKIIGASILGAEATELISALTLAIQKQLDISDIRNTVFAHPTLSEAIWEAANTIR